MQIAIRLFALQREQVGARLRQVELPDGATVGDAWRALVAEFPVLEPATGVVRFARNATYAAADEPLADGDEVAVIPPVAGGSADASISPGYRRIQLSPEPIADTLLATLRREVATSEDGALVLFLGQTRDSPGTPAPGQEASAERLTGQQVQELTYEAFDEMALAVLDALASEIEARFGVRRLAIVHRVGIVPLGEASVVIAAAAPHRDQAFAACRYAIEELKARAPIWKAERFADGSVWLGAPARTGPPDPPDPPATKEHR